SLVYATMDGVVRSPSAFSMTFALPPSMIATHELVVPRSIPMILPMVLLPLESGCFGAVFAADERYLGSPCFSSRTAAGRAIQSWLLTTTSAGRNRRSFKIGRAHV